MRKQGNQKMKSILHNLGYNSAKKLAIKVREPSCLYSSYYFGTREILDFASHPSSHSAALAACKLGTRTLPILGTPSSNTMLQGVG